MASRSDPRPAITTDTSPLILLDRLRRLNVNRLFTARCDQQFRLELTGGTIHSKIKDHSNDQEHDQAVPKRSVIGIGGGKNYTLNDPASDHHEFLSASNRASGRYRGFGRELGSQSNQRISGRKRLGR